MDGLFWGYIILLGMNCLILSCDYHDTKILLDKIPKNYIHVCIIHVTTLIL